LRTLYLVDTLLNLYPNYPNIPLSQEEIITMIHVFSTMIKTIVVLVVAAALIATGYNSINSEVRIVLCCDGAECIIDHFGSSFGYTRVFAALLTSSFCQSYAALYIPSFE
jgi:hypothetical protein